MDVRSDTRPAPGLPTHLLAALALIGGVLIPGIAAAQLRVSVVDWVQGRSEIPHPALNGRPTMLQAIAEGGDCGGAYQYRWDINGDQDYDDANEQLRNANSNGWFAALGLDVQLPDAQGDRLFFPKVEVRCGAETVSATMPVKVTVDRLCPNYPNDENCAGDQSLGVTRTVHANRAVDRGLWYMFTRFSHRGDDSHGNNVHVCTYPGTPNMYGHGHAINAFLRRGHGHGPGRDSDVYYRHVTQCGLHALISTYAMSGGAPRFDDTAEEGVHDRYITYTNGVLGGQSYFPSYASTAWVEPLASFGEPDYVSPVGQAAIRGRTLRSLGQDLADGLIQCSRSDGGWHYGCDNGNWTTTDASTNGWAPESLRLLERKMGLETYQDAKNQQRVWLGNHCPNGDCSYHHGGYKLSGNALVGYGWVDDQVYSGAGNHLAHVRALESIRPGQGFWGLYYIYAMTKGLRSFVPEITYLPNGTDWSAMNNQFLLPHQQANGSWNWVGHWDWAGNINQDSRTALTVQIIQTWLETQAWARATPLAAGPGIDITFDHAWSHVLDPSVHIVRYRWNVIDRPEDDVNGDGRVDHDEIVWEHETDDLNDPLVFQYDDDLDWGEVVTRNVVLEVTDSEGRTVTDDANVEIELSLRNHVPVIVGHPDGGDAVYGGYLGTPILLDGRSTYDVDTEHAVFPGDANRPEGVPDRITSLHFDLNLDGDFDDAGEDGALGPVTFVPRPGQAAGDRIAVPIRACDDGQWNGECYDGVTRADCSECAFGTASVIVVENLEPPAIDPGGPYSAQPGEETPLDLTGTRDPEGVLGMTYRYELIEGDGTLLPTPGYPGGNGDWGPRPIYTPDPDGARTDVIRATVTDYGDLRSEADIEIAVANVPPIIDFWAVQYTGRGPTIQGGVSVVNLGNGRYRASIDAVPDTRYDAWLEYQGHDPHGEPVTGAADINGDGGFTAPVPGNRGTVGPQVVAANAEHRATVRLSDGDDTVSAARDLRAPFADPTLRYFFDVGADGRYEVAGGGANQVEFQVPPGTDAVRIAGMVRGSGGDPALFDQVVQLDNRPPVFEQASVVGQNDFDVVVSASAVDPDGDGLTYTVDWGDGSPPTVTQGGISQHAYPDGVYRAYTVTITADDGRGGTAQRQLAVDFPEPPENQAPRFEFTRVLDQDGFEVVIAASAADPDGDVLTYTFDWADGSPPTTNQGGVAAHVFPEGAFGVYDVTITADDGRGGRDQRVVQVEFEAPAENRPPSIDAILEISRVDFNVTLAAEASDPDGDPLTYRFAWADGSPDTVNRGGIAAHRFPDGQFRAYAVTVTVTDDRGGSASDTFDVGFEAPPENRPPVVDQFVEISRDGFAVTVAASAADPDGDPVAYTFDWGDGSPATRNAGGVAVHRFADGAFRGYDVAVTADDGRGGAAQEALRVEFEAPAENRPPVIDQLVQIGRDGFEVVVSASGIDPDGDSLTYTFEWGDGSQSANAGGVATHAYPEGQFQSYEVTAIARDGRGGEARRTLEIDFPRPAANEDPVIARLDEISRDGFRVAIAASAVDPDGDPLTYTIDWGDGSQPAGSPGGVGVHDFPAGDFRAYDVTVTVTDGRGGSAQRTLRVDFPAPAQNRPPAIDFAREIGRTGFEVVISASATDPDGDPLTYTFTWGDGAPAMTNAGGVGVHLYPAGQFRAYTVTVTADDGRGGTAQADVEVDFPAPAANRPPRIEVAREIGRSGFELVASATAVDPDGDLLTYTFDWGDDSPPSQNAGGLADHVYPAGQFRAYTITVTVDDGRGGQDTAEIDVDFPAPAANRPPVIESLREIGRDGFEVVVSATAVDPDGGALVYTFEWGDGDAPGVSVGGLAVHGFPRGAFETYTVTVTADDGRGGTAEAQIDVDFPAPAANRPPVIEVARVLGVDGFEAVLTATAADPDGDDLTYTFEWGDDGPSTTNAGGVAAHVYPANVFRPYTVVITADDGQGGSDTAEVTVDFPPPAENVPPFFEVARELSRDGFGVVVTATAVDPNGDPVTYTFDWGDGSPPTTNRAGLAEHAYPPGDYRAYTVTVTADDGRGGAVATDVEIDFPPPDQNRPPVIEVARVLSVDGFEATLTASAVDPDGDPITYTFDWADDSPPTENRAGLAAHRFPEGEYRTWPVTVSARDGRGGEASAEVEVTFVAPDQNRPPAFELVRELSRDGFEATLAASAVDPDGDPLTYTFDWGDGSPVTRNAGGIAPHAFPDGMFAAYTVAVTVEDGRGGAATEELVVEFVAPDQNRPPVIEELRLVRQEGFEVLAVVGAVDPDGDGLTYTFDWGDAAADTVNRSGLAAHRYPADVYQRYTVAVTVDDGRGGTAEAQASVEYVAPAENRPPVIRGVTLEMGPRGRAELVIEAVDPEGGPLTHFVDWGDAGGELLRLPGGRGSHVYPFAEEPYAGRVTVADDEGLEAQADFAAAVVDSPTVIREITARELRAGTWFFDIVADDPDSPDTLTYAYDFQSDGAWEVLDAENSESVWIYEPPGQYTARVAVTDPWSGARIEDEITVGQDGDNPFRLPPRIEEVFVEIGPGGQTSVAVDAVDPEGGPLSGRIRWGDEEVAEGEEPAWSPLPNLVGEHRYAYDPDEVPYAGVVQVTDDSGLTAEMPFTAPIVDLPTTMLEMAVQDGGAGDVLARATARDPDSAELMYAFDFDGDGTHDTGWLAEGIAQHVYDVGGGHTMTIDVRDPWSGTVTPFEHDFEIEQWVDRPGIADASVQGIEGQCVGFAVGEESLVIGPDDQGCAGAEPPEQDLWTWDFGDGTQATGRDVSHRYADDGSYLARVWGGPPEAPLGAKVAVSIANSPPSFVTEPPELATAGRPYTYAIEVIDAGETDIIRLELMDAPEGMLLTEYDDGRFTLDWDVPPDATGDVIVELRATDGHKIDEAWVPDGGQTTQRYVIRISGDIDPVYSPDYGPPEADVGPTLDDFTGSGCACDAGDDSPAGLLWGLLAIVGLIGLRRRR